MARSDDDIARPRIALLGDDRGHVSHQELNALIPRLRGECGVEAAWAPTDSGFDVRGCDGVWLVPGSPYADDDAVLAALTVVREAKIPFLGTCGGLQYAVVEYVRSVLGHRATHAESDGERADNVIAASACSIYGLERVVTPVAGTRFASWAPEPFVGMHYCNYTPTAATTAALEASGVVISATADDVGPEVFEFPSHPFYVGSMFQPHIGAAGGRPIHPLLLAFVAAVRVKSHDLEVLAGDTTDDLDRP